MDAILLLGNALLMLDQVECKGEKNHDYLLGAMQNVRNVYHAMKEANEHGADNEQRKDVSGNVGVESDE